MPSRRVFVVFLALCLGPAVPAFAEPARLSAAKAHQKAATNQLVLIDIRSPGEWRDTGIGASATPISMHLPGFMEKVAKATGGDTSRPVAVICASGGRSSVIAPKLEQAGYTNITNVVEGMLGGRYGKGWIPSGLPLKPYSP
ncbi:MAG: rhodanese-like domain-containing protein [Methyloligellaceae bacterium]